MSRHDKNIPLVVDLDGTLIKTDLLLESFYAMIRQDPFSIFCVPVWLLRGKTYLKNKLAERAHINVKTLPYHPEFLEYLRAECAKGRPLVLATASIKKFAQEIAAYLGIFSSVFATDQGLNLAGKNKRKFLVEKYGEKGFDYAGNATPDLYIFPSARQAIVVSAPLGVLKIAQQTSQVQHVFAAERVDAFTYFKAIRVYQWMKNLLLFVPLITSHEWDDVSTIGRVVLGFISFGLCASGGYLFNDLLDLSADRSHPRKKKRPLASGEISIWAGSFLLITCQLIGLSMAAMIDLYFFALVLLYCVISLAYTLHLKTYVLIDVLVLAGLYTLRVIAGAALVGVSLSFWLFAFSIFIFFSLALVKRCSELITVANMNSEYASGRDYSVSDIDHLREMGIASGYLAILIFALYINSPDIAVLYARPKMLWMACPILFYWVSRLWLKTGRGEMTDDPIVFSVKDRGSRYVAIAMVIIILSAI